MAVKAWSHNSKARHLPMSGGCMIGFWSYWICWICHDNRSLSLVDPDWLMFELCQIAMGAAEICWDLQICAASQPIPAIPKLHGLRGKHAIEPGFTKDAVDEKVPQEKQRGTTTESTVATYTGGQGWTGMADVYWCFLFAATWTLEYMGLSENRVYSQWNSHLIGIMISKTIGFRGTLFSDTPIWNAPCKTFAKLPNLKYMWGPQIMTQRRSEWGVNGVHPIVRHLSDAVVKPELPSPQGPSLMILETCCSSIDKWVAGGPDKIWWQEKQVNQGISDEKVACIIASLQDIASIQLTCLAFDRCCAVSWWTEALIHPVSSVEDSFKTIENATGIVLIRDKRYNQDNQVILQLDVQLRIEAATRCVPGSSMFATSRIQRFGIKDRHSYDTWFVCSWSLHISYHYCMFVCLVW